MDTILIIGIESVAGANIAATLQGATSIVGISAVPGIQIDGCRILQSGGSIEQQINAAGPDRIIFCGASARSTWDLAETRRAGFDDSLAVDWATAANAAGIEFTMISSDAVFTGPWMSHAEDDTHFCETPQAERLRQIESEVVRSHSRALVVRCNVFGWSPTASALGFAEAMLANLETGGRTDIQFLCHSGPILATELATMVCKAHATGLSGFLHLGSAERVNPFQFAERLAEAAGLQPPQFPGETTLENPVTGFGRGETMLNCRRASALLGIRMPLLSDGINGFLAQTESGFRTILRSDVGELSRVA